jgi:DNA-binding GntR family transcriptional regulator
VYRQLRRDILNGELLPGARLPFAELSARYGGSMSAIREGLQRLVEQGLVVSEPQIGFSVVSLSVEDLIDLTVARCEIEALALRYAIENGELAWESQIVAAQYALDHTPLDASDPELHEDWIAAHRRFHEALIGACPNHRLRSIASNLRDAAELYRHWSRNAEGATSIRDIGAEHRHIVDAVLTRDVNEAVRLLEQHLRRTAERLLDSDTDSSEPALLTSSD